MSYATKQNMIDRFAEAELIQLTDRDNTGVIDDSVLDQALVDADARIDGYLQGRYQLPLSAVPPSLVRYACDLARYFLYDDHPTESVQKKYDDAARFLELVSKGQIDLGVSNQGAAPTPAAGAQMSSDGRVFGRENSDDFI